MKLRFARRLQFLARPLENHIAHDEAFSLDPGAPRAGIGTRNSTDGNAMPQRRELANVFVPLGTECLHRLGTKQKAEVFFVSGAEGGTPAA